MNKIEPLYNLYIARNRFKNAKNDLAVKLENIKNLKPLSRNEIDKLKTYWGDVKVNILWFAIYKACHDNVFDCRYIPDDIYYCLFDALCYSRPLRAKYLDDKNLYSLLFSDVRQPKTIGRKMSFGYQDENYSPVSEEELLDKCRNKGVIIKQSIASLDGNGVTIISKDASDEERLNVFNKYPEFVIQELLAQHEQTKSLHKESLNTIRMVSFYHNGEYHILSSIIRIGLGDSKVDSSGLGGIFCGISEDGRLKDRAFDTSGIQYDKHPSGAIFKEHYIPNFEECKTMVLMLAPRLVGVGRLLAWDLAIGD